MKISMRALALFLVSCSLARADVVTDWNAIALKLAASSGNPALASRTMATVHVALFEALNFVQGGYVPRFLVEPPVLSGISGEAAAASAAHYVLVQFYPRQRAALGDALDHSLAGLPEGKDKSGGRMTGRHLGTNIYAVLASGEFPDAQSKRTAPAAELLIWHPIVARLSAAQRLKPIEAARMHALVSMAVNDIYTRTWDVGDKSAPGYPCAPCAAGAAVLTIFGSEFGAGDVPNPKTGGATPEIQSGLALVRASSPLAREVSYQYPAGVADKRGTLVGLRLLTYFRPVDPSR